MKKYLKINIILLICGIMLIALFIIRLDQINKKSVEIVIKKDSTLTEYDRMSPKYKYLFIK